MDDLQIARQLLEEGNSLAIVKNGVCLFTHQGTWIHPIVAAVEMLGDELQGAAIADRVIGKAAAVLCILYQPACVYTPIASRSAVAVFAKSDICFSCDEIVEGIQNRVGTGLCLAEKTLLDIVDPKLAFEALWDLLGKELPPKWNSKGETEDEKVSDRSDTR
jgi:hypothetical protein